MELLRCSLSSAPCFSIGCPLAPLWSAWGRRAIPGKASTGQRARPVGTAGSFLGEVLALSVTVTVELAESEVWLPGCHGGYREGMSLFESHKFPHFPTVAYPRPGTVFTG